MNIIMPYIRRRVQRITPGRRIGFTTALLLALWIIFFSCTYVKAVPIALVTAETVAKGSIERVIMDSAREAIGNNEAPLFSKVIDSQGTIRALEADVNAINTLSSEVVKNIHKNVKKMGAVKIKVPVGSTVNAKMLHGIGPEITVRGTPYVAAYAHIDSEFSDAGINQTLHKMILTVTADVTVVCADRTVSFTAQCVLTVSEEILVGNVPEGFIY